MSWFNWGLDPPEPDEQRPFESMQDEEEAMAYQDSIKFTHAICQGCWAKVNPDHQPKLTMVETSMPCCFCSKQVTEGIFVSATSGEGARRMAFTAPVKRHK